jgi:hypothetical protein
VARVDSSVVVGSRRFCGVAWQHAGDRSVELGGAFDAGWRRSAVSRRVFLIHHYRRIGRYHRLATLDCGILPRSAAPIRCDHADWCRHSAAFGGARYDCPREFAAYHTSAMRHLTKRWSEPRPGAKFGFQMTKPLQIEAKHSDGRSRSACSR